MAEFQRPRGSDNELNILERRIKQAVRSAQTPFAAANGRLIENIKFTPGIVRTIVHKLDKKPRGFVVVDMEFSDKSIAIPSASYSVLMIKCDSKSSDMVVTSSDNNAVTISIWFW